VSRRTSPHIPSATIHPVILSGGSGERLWPLSRAHYPKQLLPLAGERTMLQESALRVANPALYAAPLVIANHEHRFIVAEQLHQVGIVPRRIVLEPVGRNTAPAAAVAALILQAEDPAALMALLPSDHVVQDQDAFSAAMDKAATAAASGALVTFGIRPRRPETGYGYIKRGEPLAEVDGAFAVAAFVEKPDAARAEAYIAAGTYDWNSGVFVFSVQSYLAELERHRPDMLAACRKALAGGTPDLDFLRLDEQAFTASASESIDYAVMEQTDRAVVIPADFGWSDVGAWDALWEITAKDADGNVILGNCMSQDSTNSYVRSDDGRLIAVIGIQDMVVVSTGDAVLIAPRAQTAAVKDIVKRLKDAGRAEATHHRRIYRPWGNFTDIDRGGNFRAKLLEIKPGCRISLQKHKQRSEHWVVVQGTAKVTRGEEVSLLHVNQSIYIPQGVVHRLENPGPGLLHIVEVQVGDYLEEDDIIRIEDAYGRTEATKP
jgi:mannose-1-phosphate guanylyltransferase/mannose-1-phosphate guanylyltransferase/mannose-6-phosphate isomerase